MEKLKYQIHAETCISQATLWIIIILLSTQTWLTVLGWIMFFGNLGGFLKTVPKLGKNYLD